MPALQNLRTKPRIWLSAGLLATGLAAGAVLGLTMTAGASTATSSAASTAAAAPGTPAVSGGSSAPARTPPGPLPKSGTVTAVGSASVTIDGTSYAVTSTSDIDKNGESTLSALAVGDTVTFRLDSSASTPTIDKLHAGNEALDRPAGAPPQGTGSQAPPSSSAAGG